MWGIITDDTLCGWQENEWITNIHESEFPKELAELSSIIQQKIWVNRNKKVFNTKDILNIQQMVTAVAGEINTHIRAQRQICYIKQENAILAKQTYTPKKKWRILWQRILEAHCPSSYWAILKEQSGDRYCMAACHNPPETYKTGLAPIHYQAINWKITQSNMTLEELVNFNYGFTTTQKTKKSNQGKKKINTETKQQWLDWQISTSESESDSESNIEENAQIDELIANYHKPLVQGVTDAAGEVQSLDVFW